MQEFRANSDFRAAVKSLFAPVEGGVSDAQPDRIH